MQFFWCWSGKQCADFNTSQNFQEMFSRVQFRLSATAVALYFLKKVLNSRRENRNLSWFCEWNQWVLYLASLEQMTFWLLLTIDCSESQLTSKTLINISQGETTQVYFSLIHWLRAVLCTISCKNKVWWKQHYSFISKNKTLSFIRVYSNGAPNGGKRGPDTHNFLRLEISRFLLEISPKL